MVRIQPDPPILPELQAWGISSAGRAPALQAGGRRFDPVILHQFLRARRSAHARSRGEIWRERFERIGCCSLTIRRVESALPAAAPEGAWSCRRQDDCVTRLQFEREQRVRVKCGTTRYSIDRAIDRTVLDRASEDVKVIGSSD